MAAEGVADGGGGMTETNATARPSARGVVDGEPGRLRVPKGHCRNCAQPVPSGRRNWCGQRCVDDYLLRNSPAVARRAVFKRDRGVCALCGRDCEALRRRIERWIGGRADTNRANCANTINTADDWRHRQRCCRLLRRLARIGPLTALWQMDHTRPVVEGGGGCGLDNLRTLCLPCHKRVTRDLARRRAERRAEQRATRRALEAAR